MVILERNREALGTLLYRVDKNGYDAKKSNCAHLKTAVLKLVYKTLNVIFENEGTDLEEFPILVRKLREKSLPGSAMFSSSRVSRQRMLSGSSSAQVRGHSTDIPEEAEAQSFGHVSMEEGKILTPSTIAPFPSMQQSVLEPMCCEETKLMRNSFGVTSVGRPHSSFLFSRDSSVAFEGNTSLPMRSELAPGLFLQTVINLLRGAHNSTVSLFTVVHEDVMSASFHCCAVFYEEHGQLPGRARRVPLSYI